MEIVSKFMGCRTSYKIQFIAPAIVRYYFPKCALSFPSQQSAPVVDFPVLHGPDPPFFCQGHARQESNSGTYTRVDQGRWMERITPWLSKTSSCDKRQGPNFSMLQLADVDKEHLLILVCLPWVHEGVTGDIEE